MPALARAVEGEWVSPEGEQQVGVEVSFVLSGITDDDDDPFVCQVTDDGLVPYEGTVTVGVVSFAHTYTLEHPGGSLVSCAWDGGENEIMVVVTDPAGEALQVSLDELVGVCTVGVALVVFLLSVHVVGSWGRR